ncbi:MAG: ketol-acid reductoisomerase, partial [bacterium JZ-2024 1]
MRKVYRDPDIDDTKLRDRIVGIIGYGNQGRVQAWNLRDGGFRLLIGLRESSPSWESARQDGFEVRTLQEVAKGTQFLVFAIPDLVHGMTYQKLEEDLRPGTTLCFLHGFSIHYGLVRVRPDVNAVLVAPKGVATEFRKRFLAGSGVPAIVGVAQDFTGDALGMTLAYGKAIGCSRAGLYLSSFAEETEADLFTEQALLCGGVPFLLSEVFVSLVKAGYSEEIAYFETVQELKFIVDLICEKGL